MTEIGSVPGIYPNQLYNLLARCLGLPLHASVLPCVGCLLLKWPVPGACMQIAGACMHAPVHECKQIAEQICRSV